MAATDERIWIINADESGEVNPAELADAMFEVAGILRRIGGAVQMISRRRRVLEEPPLYLTERVDVMWAPHAPLPRQRRAEPPPQSADFETGDGAGEAEPEPVAAG